MLNTRNEEKNTVLYLYLACFVNTLTLNMYVSMSYTRLSRWNTLFVLLWLRHRNRMNIYLTLRGPISQFVYNSWSCLCQAPSRRPLPVSPRPPSGIDTSRCWARQCRRTGETPVFCTSVCVCVTRETRLSLVPLDAAVTPVTCSGAPSSSDGWDSFTDGLYTKGARAHTHRELIREWLWEPKGSSLEYI